MPEKPYTSMRTANRLGLNKIKTELEDLSFKYEHPEEYAQIESKLQETQANAKKYSVNLQHLSAHNWTKWVSAIN